MSRDSLTAIADHFDVRIPDRRAVEAHVLALARSRTDLAEVLAVLRREELQSICLTLGLDSSGREKAVLAERILAAGRQSSAETGAPPSEAIEESSPTTYPDRIFIGHGRSPLWRELKDFLSDTLGLKWEEFNRESPVGHTTVERLRRMLDTASFAFLVLTAEDVDGEGKLHARENVVHETGLFQGKLGFHRAIVLLEEECSEFSNIVGLTQIRFPKGDIMAKSEEIRRVLQREKLIQ
jgi:hypothetical protein